MNSEHRSNGLVRVLEHLFEEKYIYFDLIFSFIYESLVNTILILILLTGFWVTCEVN